MRSALIQTMNTNELITEAHEIHELDGVSRGCRILFRNAVGFDLSDLDQYIDCRARAIVDLLELKMSELRSLAKFWGASPTGRVSKNYMCYHIASTWAESVHSTFRPRSNHEIVTRDCPARFYR